MARPATFSPISAPTILRLSLSISCAAIHTSSTGWPSCAPGFPRSRRSLTSVDSYSFGAFSQNWLRAPSSPSSPNSSVAKMFPAALDACPVPSPRNRINSSSKNYCAATIWALTSCCCFGTPACVLARRPTSPSIASTPPAPINGRFTARQVEDGTHGPGRLLRVSTGPASPLLPLLQSIARRWPPAGTFQHQGSLDPTTSQIPACGLRRGRYRETHRPPPTSPHLCQRDASFRRRVSFHHEVTGSRFPRDDHVVHRYRLD